MNKNVISIHNVLLFSIKNDICRKMFVITAKKAKFKRQTAKVLSSSLNNVNYESGCKYETVWWHELENGNANKLHYVYV
jgi:hypothetical protein